MKKRVIVNGSQGKMGLEVIKALESLSSEFEIVGKLDRNDNLAKNIKATSADIVVDFTTADSAYENCKTIIEQGVHPVIGTTGFTGEQIEELKSISTSKHLGGLIAPNFSLGAVLMMKHASDVAQYFSHVEIIELHHDGKAEAPSGTSVKTCEMIAHKRTKPETKKREKILIDGARGAVNHDIHIHSVRLPGLIAHQEVLFGDAGQTLTIRHDILNRSAFMPGVILACRKVTKLKELVYGLEHLL